MAFKNIVITSVCIAIVAVCSSVFNFFSESTSNLPEIRNTSWGDGKEDINVYDFKINITEKDVEELDYQINHVRRFPNIIEDLNQYGLNPRIVKQMMDFLKYNYSVKSRLDYINTYPQYTTMIQGINIYYVHVKPQQKEKNRKEKKLALLLLHGWPNSVAGYIPLIPRLQQLFATQKIQVEIIVPSLPGFGYSEPPKKGGLETRNIAVMLRNLMSRLGHSKYYVYGNDWGSIVTSSLAMQFPDEVVGMHSNFCVFLAKKLFLKIAIGSLYPSWFVPERYVKKLYPLRDRILLLMYEAGYLYIQGTKPHSIGVAWDNSLVGLITFMLEKFSAAANLNNADTEDAGLDVYDLTAIMDNLIFYYWIPVKATVSARIYRENLSLEPLIRLINDKPIDPKVKCGCVFFEHDFLYFPESWLRDKFQNLIYYKTYPIGGHFVGLEKQHPYLLVNDIFEFIMKSENSN